MKILSTISYYTPYVSGLTLHAKRVCEALAMRHHHVSVLTNQHDKNLKKKEMLAGVAVIRAAPLVRFNKGFVSWDFVVKSFDWVRQSDVVHINLPQFEGIVPAVFGKLLGKKVVTTYHCEVVLPKGWVNIIVKFALTLSNLAALLLADCIVTYTQDFAKNSRLLPHFVHKTSYIYPPIPIPKVHKRVQNMIRNKIGQGRAFIIGVAARLSAEKGIEYLLEAIPLLEEKFKIERTSHGEKTMKTPRGWPKGFILSEAKELHRGGGIKIAIAGSLDPVGEKRYKQKIIRLVEKYKDYVVFLGELKEEEMGSFYSLLDILVLPSINSTEAFGMVQVEAMLCGVPVVASDLPGVRVPVQRTNMGLIVPCRDTHQLARAIISIVKHKKNFIKPKSDIEKEFSLAKTLTMYKNLLEESQ